MVFNQITMGDHRHIMFIQNILPRRLPNLHNRLKLNQDTVGRVLFTKHITC